VTTPAGFGFQGPEKQLMDLIRSMIETQPRPPVIIPVLTGNPSEDDATNVWLLTDGRLRTRYWNGSSFVYKEYAPIAPTGGAAPPYPPKELAPKTNVSQFAATWSQSYTGGNEQVSDGGRIYYGDSGDALGITKSLVGFDYAAIAAVLAGSTVKRVQLRMTNISTFWPDGADVFFGIHNVTSPPTTWSDSDVTAPLLTQHHFGKPETKTVDLPLRFATDIRSGTGKGIAVQSPDNDRAHSGYAAGVGSGFTPPLLIVTYAK
jgi:hypothetical protein